MYKMIGLDQVIAKVPPSWIGLRLSKKCKVSRGAQTPYRSWQGLEGPISRILQEALWLSKCYQQGRLDLNPSSATLLCALGQIT